MLVRRSVMHSQHSASLRFTALLACASFILMRTADGSLCQAQDPVSCAAAQDAEASLDSATQLLQADAASHRKISIDSTGTSLEDKAAAGESTGKAEPSKEKRASSKVGINLSIKWMKNPLSVLEAVAAIPRIKEYLGLSKPIERVKTYDLAPSNRALVEEIVRQSNDPSDVTSVTDIKELVIGIGNKELNRSYQADFMEWFHTIAGDFKGSLHIAVGNEPDRSGVHSDVVLEVIRTIKKELPNVQVTVPFAYSIMHRSHPVHKSKLEQEFIDTYKDVLPLLDYFTINIYPFLSAGVKGVAISNLTGLEMNFLNDQISALRIALDRDFPRNNLPLAIGETGWPTCGAARANPYAFATLEYGRTFVQNVAKWMESSESDGRILSGQLFTAFDEETKGTRAIERYYGILTSKGEVKSDYSCVTNATEGSQAWLEEEYPDCESDLDWMVKNFDNPYLQEKFANRDIDGSLCSFQQYLYDRWASCPPVTRVPGVYVPTEGPTVYGQKSDQTKCWSERLAYKYSDRGAIVKPNVSHLITPYGSKIKSQHTSHDETAFKLDEKPGPDRFLQAEERAPEAVQPTTLQVYWINLDSSSDRRALMEQMFADLRRNIPIGINLQVTRVPAITPLEVKAMQANSSLKVEAKLIDACTEACPTHHTRGELLYTEMACSLSHLRAIDLAQKSGAASALILEDDVRIYPEFGDDLEILFRSASPGWTALQMSTVSTKALLALASSRAIFEPREEHFFGTGSYFINRAGMQHLRQTYAAGHFQRKAFWPGAGSLQAESVLFGSLPAGTVYTATRFYFNIMDFPTTVHVMANTSNYYAVSAVNWQRNYLHRHRSRLATQAPPATGAPDRLLESSFLAMTTLVCRNNSGFAGESRSIAGSIRALKIYNFTWTVYVIISDPSEDGHCPGLESFSEFRQKGVNMYYRLAPGRFSKWVYYTEDVEQFARYDFLVVYDADMGLSTFPWSDYFQRYEDYATRFGIAPVTGSVRNRSPFHPLKADWWQRCNRSKIRFVETDLIEQWFAMLSGQFATWYLRRVVQTGIIMEQRTLGVDWGVDTTWCGAAAEWANREAGCLLIPIDMYHGDTRSLKQDMTFHQNGEHLTNLWWERLPQWMQTSSVWTGSFFQDKMLGCSPVGLEERYHMPIDLRTVVPVVPTWIPDNRSHHNVEGLTDSASGSGYVKQNATEPEDEKDGARALPGLTALFFGLAAACALA
eukprot:TRINITY_DN9816_c0_g1_i3.p1 TRINITY_DN9816_c0_g1~~TRINITY_DN9816_c0_g1_i3.p1  ORF type:complete len:1215 (+),score=209.52 TRINITY_DN9816_c0_g1_i3:82-3726(+)